MAAIASVQRLLMVLIPLIGMLSLSGCGVLEDDWESFKHDVEAGWKGIENSKEVRKISRQTQVALRDLEAAAKAGEKDAEQKALSALKAAIREMFTAWHKATTPLDHPYVISPKCLLAMAVGAGAITASSGLGLAALGFAELGIQAESFAALWQCSLGDVEAGSLFARLQSLGAKGLSLAEKFEVTGVVATISACFCGVVNDVCHHCLVDGNTATDIRASNEHLPTAVASWHVGSAAASNQTGEFFF